MSTLGGLEHCSVLVPVQLGYAHHLLLDAFCLTCNGIELNASFKTNEHFCNRPL